MAGQHRDALERARNKLRERELERGQAGIFRSLQIYESLAAASPGPNTRKDRKRHGEKGNVGVMMS